MIYAIPLLVSCAVSIWFCYWSTSVFTGLRSRPCRLACFATPIAIAVLLLVFPETLLEPLYLMMPEPLFFSWLGGATGEFVITLAILQTVFALLTAALVNELLKLRGGSGLRHK
jgi:hypothetical protein